MTKTTRQKIDDLYKIINDANEELAKERKNCPHLETKESKYMWRVGSTMDVEMCIECDEIIKSLYPYENVNQNWN